MELSRDQTIAYDKAALLCSKSEKCTSEIQDKLKLWGLSSDESEPVIKKLISEKYLDNERFARAYAKDKFRFNRWGKQKIEYMLRAKKINQETVKLALEEITDEGYSNELLNLIAIKEKLWPRFTTFRDSHQKKILSQIILFSFWQGCTTIPRKLRLSF